jgi:hypothetical protein
MRVIIALAVLAVCISMGACSRPKQAAYAKPRPSALPYPTKASSVKPGPTSVRKSPEPTKVTAVKPPPLPPKTPSQSQSVSVPSPAEAKFKAAQEKAKLRGVHTLTQEDIEGLGSEQIKELRGY